MDDPQKREWLINRGQKAKELLENHDFNWLCQLFQDDLTTQIMSTTLDQAEDREILFQTFNGLRAALHIFTSYASIGIDAQNEPADEAQHEED